MDGSGNKRAMLDNFSIVSVAGSSLPVDLTLFSAEKVEGGSVHLRWTTASEANNDRFEIERRSAIDNWKMIASVSGGGTTDGIREYGSLDSSPVKGTGYYRLRQVDFDGTHQYSEVRSVTTTAITAAPLLYPNPTKGILNVFASGLTLDQEINLYTSEGQDVGRQVRVIQQASGHLELDLSSLPGDCYYLRLSGRSYPICKLP